MCATASNPVPTGKGTGFRAKKRGIHIWSISRLSCCRFQRPGRQSLWPESFGTAISISPGTESPRLIAGRYQYLGFRFRRLLGLDLGQNRYWHKGEAIAERLSEADGVTRSSTIQVRRTAVLGFLKETDETLLWCLRSQRFSERTPGELRLAINSRVFRGPSFHYEFRVLPLPDHEKEKRSRMRTMTELFGKGVLDLL
jgi:hypothetical protein